MGRSSTTEKRVLVVLVVLVGHRLLLNKKRVKQSRARHGHPCSPALCVRHCADAVSPQWSGRATSKMIGWEPSFMCVQGRKGSLEIQGQGVTFSAGLVITEHVWNVPDRELVEAVGRG